MVAVTGSIVKDGFRARLEALGHAALHCLAIAAHGVRMGTGVRFVAEVAE